MVIQELHILNMLKSESKMVFADTNIFIEMLKESSDSDYVSRTFFP